MKIIVAIDSFKGSLTANEAAEAVARGASQALPGAEIKLAPLGDGGEGTVAALVEAVPGSRTFTVPVRGPLGDTVDASFGILGPAGRIAVVEMAAASGITLIPRELRNPMKTSTYGVGQLIRAALSVQGVADLVIGLGGSATNDGGAGAAEALGVEYLDRAGYPLPSFLTGGDVGRIGGFAQVGERFDDLDTVTIACDVTNPLCGPSGASAVFGPQKGADDEMARRLDADLELFADVLDRLAEARGGRGDGSIADIPGSGAAGGLAAGLLAFFPSAVLRPGIDLVLGTIRFDEMLRGADLVITGEGKLDSQTLSGKAIDGVLRRASAAGVPVFAFAGSVDQASAAALAPCGLTAAFGLTEIAASVEDAIANAGKYLEELAKSRLSRLRQPLA